MDLRLNYAALFFFLAGSALGAAAGEDLVVSKTVDITETAYYRPHAATPAAKTVWATDTHFVVDVLPPLQPTPVPSPNDDDDTSSDSDDISSYDSNDMDLLIETGTIEPSPSVTATVPPGQKSWPIPYLTQPERTIDATPVVLNPSHEPKGAGNFKTKPSQPTSDYSTTTGPAVPEAYSKILPSGTCDHRKTSCLQETYHPGDSSPTIPADKPAPATQTDFIPGNNTDSDGHSYPAEKTSPSGDLHSPTGTLPKGSSTSTFVIDETQPTSSPSREGSPPDSESPDSSSSNGILRNTTSSLSPSSVSPSPPSLSSDSSPSDRPLLGGPSLDSPSSVSPSPPSLSSDSSPSDHPLLGGPSDSENLPSSPTLATDTSQKTDVSPPADNTYPLPASTDLSPDGQGNVPKMGYVTVVEKISVTVTTTATDLSTVTDTTTTTEIVTSEPCKPTPASDSKDTGNFTEGAAAKPTGITSLSSDPEEHAADKPSDKPTSEPTPAIGDYRSGPSSPPIDVENLPFSKFPNAIIIDLISASSQNRDSQRRRRDLDSDTSTPLSEDETSSDNGPSSEGAPHSNSAPPSDDAGPPDDSISSGSPAPSTLLTSVTSTTTSSSVETKPVVTPNKTTSAAARAKTLWKTRSGFERLITALMLVGLAMLRM